MHIEGNLDLFKNEFYQTKAELDNISIENKRLKSLLDDFLNNKSYNNEDINLNNNYDSNATYNKVNFNNDKINFNTTEPNVNYKSASIINSKKEYNTNTQENINICDYRKSLSLIKDELLNITNKKSCANIMNHTNSNSSFHSEINNNYKTKKLYSNINTNKNRETNYSYCKSDNNFNINTLNEINSLSKFKQNNKSIKEKLSNLCENNLLNGSLVNMVGIFLSLGLDDNTLNNCFNSYFVSKNNFIELFESNNYKNIIENLLKIILKSYNINYCEDIDYTNNVKIESPQVSIPKETKSNIKFNINNNLNTDNYIKIDSNNDKDDDNNNNNRITYNNFSNNEIINNINKNKINTKETNHSIISKENVKSKSVKKVKLKKKTDKSVSKSKAKNIKPKKAKLKKEKSVIIDKEKSFNKSFSNIIKPRGRSYFKSNSVTNNFVPNNNLKTFELSLRYNNNKNNLNTFSNKLILDNKQKKHFPDKQSLIFHTTKIDN